MSLYMMIEIKDAEESNQILPKYTVTERIYEQVRDFRANTDKAKHNPRELQQRGIIMTIDLQKMNQFYSDKKKAQLKKQLEDKERQNLVKKMAVEDGQDNMLTIPKNLKKVSRGLQENDQGLKQGTTDEVQEQDQDQEINQNAQNANSS